MTALEDQLSEAMHGQQQPGLRPGAARLAWKAGRRRAHRRQAGSAGLVLAVGVVGTAGVVDIVTHRPGAARLETASGGDCPGTPMSFAPYASNPPHPLTASQQAAGARLGLPADKELAGIGLPDPSPGFPYRRQTGDSFPVATTNGKGGKHPLSLTMNFLVSTDDERGHLACGESLGGQQATVIVSRDGALADDPYYLLIDTTTVRGQPAQVLTESGEHRQIEVRAHVDGFELGAYGPNGTVDKLDALLDSLTGLPDPS